MECCTLQIENMNSERKGCLAVLETFETWTLRQMEDTSLMKKSGMMKCCRSRRKAVPGLCDFEEKESMDWTHS